MSVSDPPVVSVVIPAFNAQATIRETLESARAQTYRELEFLVVDDGSTDATAAVVEAMIRVDERIRLLRKINGGLSSARNFGIAHSRGSTIAFLDADDLWDREKVAKQLQALYCSNRAAGAVYTWFWPIDASGRIKDVVRYVSVAEDDIYAALVLNNFIASGSTLMIRKEVLWLVGGFDESLRNGCEDLDFCLRLAERVPFAVVPEFLVGYRQRADSMSHKVRELEPAYKKVIARAQARHPELPPHLFRWSRSRFSMHLGRALWRSGMILQALPFLIKALHYDPALILCFPYKPALTWLLSRLGARGIAAGQSGRPYTQCTMAELATALPSEPPAYERRRRAYVASLRVRPVEEISSVGR